MLQSTTSHLQKYETLDFGLVTIRQRDTEKGHPERQPWAWADHAVAPHLAVAMKNACLKQRIYISLANETVYSTKTRKLDRFTKAYLTFSITRWICNRILTALRSTYVNQWNTSDLKNKNNKSAVTLCTSWQTWQLCVVCRNHADVITTQIASSVMHSTLRGRQNRPDNKSVVVPKTTTNHKRD